MEEGNRSICPGYEWKLGNLAEQIKAVVEHKKGEQTITPTSVGVMKIQSHFEKVTNLINRFAAADAIDLWASKILPSFSAEHSLTLQKGEY